MDVRVVVAVVVSLAVVACLCVGGITIASAIGHEPPPTLGTIAGTCIGALAMLLVNPHASARLAPPQNVVNTITPIK